MIRRTTFALAAVLLATAVFTGACGHRHFVHVACAAELTEYAGPAGGGARSGGSPGGGSHSSPPSRQNASAKPPSAAHSTATQNQAKPPTGQNRSTTPGKPGDPAKTSTAKATKVTPPREKAYTPPRADVRPPAKQYDAAARSAPDRVSRGGSYRSPVTHHVYVFHDPLYYSSSSYLLDLYDPFNPWNRTNPYSPFFGMPYTVVDSC